MQGIERPEAPDVPDGYIASLGLLALVDAEQGRNDSAERTAREAIGFAREHFQADAWAASLAHLALALACLATGRLDEAEREALAGEADCLPSRSLGAAVSPLLTIDQRE